MILLSHDDNMMYLQVLLMASNRVRQVMWSVTKATISDWKLVRVNVPVGTQLIDIKSTAGRDKGVAYKSYTAIDDVLITNRACEEPGMFTRCIHVLLNDLVEHTHLPACTHIHTHTHAYTQTHARTHACTHAHTHTNTHTHTHTHTHIHTRIH